MKDRVLDLAVPNPTPALFLLALAAAVLLASDSLGWAGFLLLGLVLIPSGVHWFARNPTFALAALIFASAMPRYFVEIGALKARPEHLVAVPLCLAAVFIYKHSEEPPRWIFADSLLLAYVALILFSSVFRSVEPAQTFKWSMQQILVIASYFLIRLLTGNVERFRLAVNIMLLAGMAEGVYAAVCFYSNLLFKTEFGLDPAQYEHAPGVYGTQYEGNLLGSYCAVALIMATVMYLHKAERKYLWGVGLTYLGMLVSFSRGAMLAAGIAMVGLVVFARISRVANRTTVLKVVAVFLLVSVLVGLSVVPLYVERFSTLDRSDPYADENTKVRLLILGVALDHIIENPVFGTGTASFQLMFDYKQIGYFDADEISGWIGTTEIRVLHDTGLLGLAAFTWFVLYLLIRGIRFARWTRSPELAGLLLSSIVYLLAFQASEGTLLAFSWVHLGMTAAAIAGYAGAGVDATVRLAAATGQVAAT